MAQVRLSWYKLWCASTAWIVHLRSTSLGVWNLVFVGRLASIIGMPYIDNTVEKLECIDIKMERYETSRNVQKGTEMKNHIAPD